MTEKKMVTLGRFFPPLWLLGTGALGAVLLCLYIGVGVWETEKIRATLENTLEKHRQIVERMPVMEQEFKDLQTQLAEARAQKLALEQSLKGLRAQEDEIRKLLAQRDSAVMQRNEADKTRSLFQKQQQTLLKEKEQAEQEKLSLEKQLVRLRAEHEGLVVSTEIEAQQKLNELVQQEQQVLEGFSKQMNAALGKFTSSVDTLVDTGKTLSAQGTNMSRAVESLAEARTAMQKEHGEAVRSFAETTSAGAAAQKQAVESLREQARAIAADAEEFAHQIAGGRKAVSEVTTGLQAMRNGMAATDKTMQDMTNLTASLSQIRLALETSLREVAERSRQLEENVRALSQETSGLHEGRTGIDEARRTLDRAITELQENIRKFETALQTPVPTPVSVPKEGEGQDAPQNNEAVVPVEHVPAQEQQ